NIDPEHLDHYGTFDRVREGFAAFVENVPFYGFAVMCSDHPEVQSLIGRIGDRRIITYGENPQADVRFVDLKLDGPVSHFAVEIRNRRTGVSRRIDGLNLPMPGLHNVSNATAAIAVADELGVSAEAIRTGLSGFGGVKRRFTHTGNWNGVDIFDDYGHHPVEIAAVLRAARTAASGNVVAVVQPHRYTRLRDHFDEFCSCFNDADTVIVADVYPAGEAPIEGYDRTTFVAGLKARGHRHVLPLEGAHQLASLIAATARPGDFVVCLGAGNITAWANALPGELAAYTPGGGDVE
ncbi:MAG: UDP-N-acetylmuramate--L-alanine ligase, partial [Hyphomicrobiales bacterium]|nr:UDP-N-acetylmuramate--L-alanine ligase [Hyphomicrobiales bacterium]